MKKECTKVKFAREEDADTHIERGMKTSKSPLSMRAYFCPKCSVWHVTSKDKRGEKIRLLTKEVHDLKEQLKAGMNGDIKAYNKEIKAIAKRDEMVISLERQLKHEREASARLRVTIGELVVKLQKFQ